MSDAAGGLGVLGLESLWARITRRAPGAELAMADRVMLDALGLGLEQTLGQLTSVNPGFAAFEDWIVATAGAPDPDLLARYHAWLDGAAPPERVRQGLAAIECADPVFDASDLAHWDREGWAILRDAIAPAEARAAAELLWRVCGADPADPATWYGPCTNGLMVQHFQDPALEPARRSPRVHKAFAQLWGTTDLWARIDRMSFNAPERPGRSFFAPRLHWDVSLAPPIPFGTQAILYLSDTAADQGALELVPGFHRRIEAWLASLGDADPRRVDLRAEAITIAAGAGDLIIWRHELPHGASPNRTDRPRLAQYVNMYDGVVRPRRAWR